MQRPSPRREIRSVIICRRAAVQDNLLSMAFVETFLQAFARFLQASVIN